MRQVRGDTAVLEPRHCYLHAYDIKTGEVIGPNSRQLKCVDSHARQNPITVDEIRVNAQISIPFGSIHIGSICLKIER